LAIELSGCSEVADRSSAKELSSSCGAMDVRRTSTDHFSRPWGFLTMTRRLPRSLEVYNCCTLQPRRKADRDAIEADHLVPLEISHQNIPVYCVSLIAGGFTNARSKSNWPTAKSRLCASSALTARAPCKLSKNMKPELRSSASSGGSAVLVA